MLKSMTTIDSSLYVLVYNGKDTGKILLKRLHEYLDQAEILPESQSGFRKDRRTIDMIFSVRNSQEEYLKQNMDLYMIFIDVIQLLTFVEVDMKCY